jgi:hypothetical protein
MVWEMYEGYSHEATIEYPLPTWEYYCEEDNELGDFYDEVMSYLAFDDFTQYQFLTDPNDMEKWHDMFGEHGTALDEDFILLFDEMRLSMMDSANTFNWFPIVQVW